MDVKDLVGLALRRNPKRAHLLVSRVLAKHVPTVPSLAIAAGLLLGAMVAERLAGLLEHSPELRSAAEAFAASLRSADGPLHEKPALLELRKTLTALATSHPGVVTIGYAETATGLGRLVAESIGSYYIHSTRHSALGSRPVAAFEEGHSHATSHRLLPAEDPWLRRGGTVVLVDDELSTGSTIINTIRELHRLMPQREYIVAALVDLRAAGDRERFDELSGSLGATISVVALSSGRINLGPDILPRCEEFIAALPAAPPSPAAELGSITFLAMGTEEVAPISSDRFGNNHAVRVHESLGSAAAIAARVRAAFAGRSPEEVLVLGTEEFISLPLAVAHALDTDFPVRFSTTTRSPIVALDRPDYAIASSVGFTSHDATEDGPGPRFAYNLSRAGFRFGTIIVMPEPGTDPAVLSGTGSITEALSAICGDVVVVLLPAASPAAAADNFRQGPHAPHQ
ncbi:phosphoribosyltransferase domain-containing protein [Paeniglutamicibacter antarcticus]|uniref:Phosphoribosyltransferase domain-containing protein n=2 Tax=Arthrobacter terrae TaxID=2935737 RepID=A0A931CQV3_9MICC|nr:phosphoribosyltransferase domain-containing protein [Arthrobacter terrae]